MYLATSLQLPKDIILTHVICLASNYKLDHNL